MEVAEIKHWTEVFTEMEKRKASILGTIEEQGKLTLDDQVFGVAADQLQRLGIVLLEDEAAGVGDGAVQADGFDDGDVRLVGLGNHALDLAFAHLLAVVIDQENLPGGW